jgi:hypothetical protein
MKPVEHRVGLRRGRALNRAQPGIAIGQDRDARVWVDAVLAQGLRDRRRAGRTASTHEGKPRRLVVDATDLPHHDLERAGRPRVPIAHIRAVEADDHGFTGRRRRASGCGSGAQ